MTSSSWDWPDLSFHAAGFCLSLSRGKDVQQVLTSYTVTPEQTQPRSYDASIELLNPGVNLLLRIGTITDVGFCFEQGSVLGIAPAVQSALSSEGGESLTICTIPERAIVTLIHAQDGQIRGMFDLGMKLHPTQTTAVFLQADSQWRASGQPKAQVALDVASTWVGAPLEWEANFAGALDTAILPASHQPPASQPPPPFQPAKSGLGRSSRPLIPPPAPKSLKNG